MKLRSGIVIGALAVAFAGVLANDPASLRADLVQRWAAAELGRNRI
jgi:hypothetical protein